MPRFALVVILYFPLLSCCVSVQIISTSCTARNFSNTLHDCNPPVECVESSNVHMPYIKSSQHIVSGSFCTSSKDINDSCGGAF